MTKSVDDVHCIDAGYLKAKQRLENANIGKENKANIPIKMPKNATPIMTLTIKCTACFILILSSNM